MPKKSKIIDMPAVPEVEEDDISKEDYADKDKLVEEALLDDDEEENVEDGEATEDESPGAIEVGDDL